MTTLLDTPPMPLGRLAALTTLEDIAIVTYDIDPERLARDLPAWLVPEVVRLADGRERALLSAVTFRDVDFRFRLAPFVKVGMVQTNYRAYVRTRDGRRAVWFHGSTLSSELVRVPRLLWRMPWSKAPATVDAVWEDGRCRSWRARAVGPWGGHEVTVEGTDEPMGTLDGFADATDTALALTHPLAGYYRRLDGRIAGYRVWHAPMHPTRGRVLHARYDVLEDLGFVAPGQAPHSVLLERRSDFHIHLPPRLLDGPLDE